MATTMGLAEAKNNFSRVSAEVAATGRPVTVMKTNRPCVAIVPVEFLAKVDPIAAAVDFMDEYADVFQKLA